MKKLLPLLLISSFVLADESLEQNSQIKNQQEFYMIQLIKQSNLTQERRVIIPPDGDCDEGQTNNGRLGEEEGTGGHCRP